MAEPSGKAGQIGGDSIGESHGRRAEIEILHRQEATQGFGSIQVTASVEQGALRRAVLTGPGTRIS